MTLYQTEFVVKQLVKREDRKFEPLALPFNANGTVAMARADDDVDSASSQFFMLVKESEVTPSGANVLDGQFGVFGYVVRNADLLGRLKVGDTILRAKVTDGGKLLTRAGPAASLARAAF